MTTTLLPQMTADVAIPLVILNPWVGEEARINLNKIIPDLEELKARRTLFVLSHSGGKDSQAMVIKALKIIPKELCIIVHACLGEVEWEGAKELAQKQAEDAGVPFLVATSNTKTFLSMVDKRFEDRPEVPCWPSSKHRQCTSDLKRDPIQRVVRQYAKEHGFTCVVNCMGLRAGESASRAKLTEWSCDKKATNNSRTWYDWLPIHKLTTAEVFQTIADAGQQPHIAYALGNDRVSCLFCIFGSVNDLRNAAILYPGVYGKYVSRERKTGYTMHMSRKSLVELTGIEPEKLLN